MQNLTEQKPKNYLRIPQVEEEYGLSQPLIRKLIRTGKLKAIRPAGARVVLIPRSALEQMMAEAK